MLLYYLFWMLMRLILHFYFIFGTNLLTQGPVQIAVFLPISVFRGKGISNGVQRNETFGSMIFGTNVIQRTWSASQEAVEAATRVEGAPTPIGCDPLSRGPLGQPPTYFFLLYIPTYPKNIRGQTKHNFHHRNLLYP